MTSVREAHATPSGSGTSSSVISFPPPAEPEPAGRDDQVNEKVQEGDAQQPKKNRMAKDMERGGILGWGSYLTFSWANAFLSLGATVALKEEHLESIYKKHERCGMFD